MSQSQRAGVRRREPRSDAGGPRRGKASTSRRIEAGGKRLNVVLTKQGAEDFEYLLDVFGTGRLAVEKSLALAAGRQRKIAGESGAILKASLNQSETGCPPAHRWIIYRAVTQRD